MADWPPRWDGPHWKPDGEQKAERQGLRRRRRDKEQDAKREVRRQDRYCRFPLCGCDRAKLQWEVAHLQHKGMGGNPAGDRSDPSRLIYLCTARHQTGLVSLHAGTLEIEPLTSDGTRGPCSFRIRQGDTWVEVGREHALHEFDPFTPEQRRVLIELATQL